MKKNIYKNLFIVFALLAMPSCGEFLDQDSVSDVTEKQMNTGGEKKYTTADQAEQLYLNLYTQFGVVAEFWQLDLFRINDCQSDNAYSGEDKDAALQLNEYRLRTSNEVSTRDWSYLSQHIAVANSALQWVPLIQDEKLTDARKKEIIGEASFIRALCYFHMVRIYGDVPLTLQEVPSLTNENIEEVYPLIYPSRSPKAEVYAQIVKDLEVAVANTVDYSPFKFRATKAVSNFLLAEVYATKDAEEGKTDWSKVRQYAKAACSNTNYGLMENYDHLFSSATKWNGKLPSEDLEYEHCKESLFEIDYTGWTALGNWGAQMFYGRDWKKFNTPSHDLYDAFTKENDIVRRDASIFFDNVQGIWRDVYWTDPTHYPFPYKMRAAEKGNVILYRLAEAILLQAEAENELNNTAEAQRLLNMVRNRAKLPNTTAATKENLRLAIENEHRFEFAFEGKRWFDLIRRGRAIEVMQNCTDSQRDYALKNLNKDMLIWPVPQNEGDLNKNLTQNPGY